MSHYRVSTVPPGFTGLLHHEGASYPIVDGVAALPPDVAQTLGFPHEAPPEAPVPDIAGLPVEAVLMHIRSATREAIAVFDEAEQTRRGGPRVTVLKALQARLQDLDAPPPPEPPVPDAPED